MYLLHQIVFLEEVTAQEYSLTATHLIIAGQLEEVN